MKYLNPGKEDIKKMFSMLFEGDLVVSDSAGLAHEYFAAVYVDENKTPGAVVLCDRNFAVFAGAALSMMHPEVAKEMAAEADLPQAILDNLHEIMNICTGLIIGETTPHLRLDSVGQVGDTDAVSTITDAASRDDYQVEIPTYGAGGLSFLVT